MIQRSDILPMAFLKKSDFTGSHKGMRYRLDRQSRDILSDAGEKEGTEEFLLCTIWPEPLNYISTPEEKKTRKEFSFDEDGVVDAVAWMNDMLFEKADLWERSWESWDAYKMPK